MKNKKKMIYKKKKQRSTSMFKEYTEMIIEVLMIVFFINTFLIQSQTIPTSSMLDTMLIGDHLLVNKVAYAPYLDSWDKFLFPQKDIKRGMIVTFKGPTEIMKGLEKEYVKRIIALPGETIKIVNKQVFINHQLLNEPYVIYKDSSISKNRDNFPLIKPIIINALGKSTYLPFYIQDQSNRIMEKHTAELCKKFEKYIIKNEKGERSLKIPPGHFFCMGDNRDNSYDSRFWGPLPQDYIIGKPWRIYWSYQSETKEYLTPGIGHKIIDIFKTIINFFPKTRWKRTFKKFE